VTVVGGKGGDGLGGGADGKDAPSQEKGVPCGSDALTAAADSVRIVAIELPTGESCVELTARMTLKESVDFASWAAKTQEKGLFLAEAGETLASMSLVERGDVTLVGADVTAGTVTLRVPKGACASGFFRVVVNSGE